MRLAPALGVWWLAAVAVLAGCSTRTAVPDAARVLTARTPPASEMANRGSSVSVPAGARVRVPHIDESDLRRDPAIGSIAVGSDVTDDIAREMAAMRSEWVVRSRDVTSNEPKAPDRSVPDPKSPPHASSDVRVTEVMIAVERRYAPEFLNGRIRIRMLESRLRDANGAARDSLLRKLEQARADLAAVDAAYQKEAELARVGVGPAVVRQEEKPGNTNRNNGAASDASPSGEHAGAESHTDQKAGGGAD